MTEPIPLYVHSMETLYSHLDALAIICLLLLFITTGLSGWVLYLLRKHQKATYPICKTQIVKEDGPTQDQLHLKIGGPS